MRPRLLCATVAAVFSSLVPATYGDTLQIVPTTTLSAETANNTTGCDMTQQAISDLTYAYNTFETSPAYLRINGRPVVMFFDPDRYGTLNWSLIASSVPGNPLFIFRNSGGFTHAATSGGYAWLSIDTTNPNNWAQSYLDNFYATDLKYPAEYGFSANFKGFNDTWAPGGTESK